MTIRAAKIDKETQFLPLLDFDAPDVWGMTEIDIDEVAYGVVGSDNVAPELCIVDEISELGIGVGELNAADGVILDDVS